MAHQQDPWISRSAVVPKSDRGRDREPGAAGEGGETSTHRDRGLIQLMSVALPRLGPELKPVVGKAGKDMQVDMEHLLERGFSVGEEQIHSFAPEARTTQSTSQPVRHRPHRDSDVFLQVLQPYCVHLWNDQQVPRSDGLEVHEGQHRLVLVNDAAGSLAPHDRAKDTSEI